MNYKPNPLRPERIRTIEKPFAWIPFRLLTGGLFADLSDKAKLLYFFLCLAADNRGLSYYRDSRILSYFQLSQQDIDLAKKELIHKNLIAYDGRLYQLLSLPSPGPSAPQKPDPAPTHRFSEPEHFSQILKRLAQETR